MLEQDYMMSTGFGFRQPIAETEVASPGSAGYIINGETVPKAVVILSVVH
jgi:hypothetical protein